MRTHPHTHSLTPLFLLFLLLCSLAQSDADAVESGAPQLDDAGEEELKKKKKKKKHKRESAVEASDAQ
jgi:hypothetical protein